MEDDINLVTSFFYLTIINHFCSLSTCEIHSTGKIIGNSNIIFISIWPFYITDASAEFEFESRYIAKLLIKMRA